MACSLKYWAADEAGAAHCCYAAPRAVQSLLRWACALYPAGFFPKDVFYVDIFLPAELRLPDWFVITKDGFLQKTADARRCRKSCLADRGSYCRIWHWNTENRMELKDKESFVVEPEVNYGKTLIGCLFGHKITCIDTGPCLRNWDLWCILRCFKCDLKWQWYCIMVPPY